MANIETRYTVEMNYIHKNKEIEIKTESIKYIYIDNDYLGKNFPVMYLSIKMKSSIYDQMVKYIDTDTVTLKINKYDASKKVKAEKKYIKDEFIYFLSNTDPNYKADIEKEAVKNKDDQSSSYRNAYIGLISLDILNYNKKIYNDVFSGNLQSIIYHYIHTVDKVIIEPFDTNKTFTNLIIPPIQGLNNLIKYLNNCSSFYDSTFRFFIDYTNTCYLLSCNGKAVKRKSGAYSSVIVDVATESRSATSKVLGMVKDSKKKCYKLNIDSSDSSFNIDQFSDKDYNKIVTVDSLGNIKKSVLETAKNSKGTRTKIFRTFAHNGTKAENIKYISNISNNILMVTKSNIDSSIVTPERTYEVSNVNQFKKYNGKYILVNKQELFRKQDEKYFTSTITLKLSKVVS